ncbi:MAG: hypothetical protein R2705_12715 [Ilumatobacteraceae bacterium]
MNRYRSVIAGEDASIDLNDLMIVGDHQLLEVAERYFCDPDRQPPRRRVVQDRAARRRQRRAPRSLGSRASRWSSVSCWRGSTRIPTIAPATRPTSPTAWRTRRGSPGCSLSGRATTAPPAGVARRDAPRRSRRLCRTGRDASSQRRALRRANVFVISPRSSLAEIQRAQDFAGPARLTIQNTDETGATVTDETLLARYETGFDETEHRDCLKRTIEESGLSQIEALVWLHRSGALDPTGHGTELPEIADDLGLEGRAEARAALRRARRKLDAWSAHSGRMAVAG